MASISQALQIADAQQSAGRFDLAAEIYRRVLAASPGQPQAVQGLARCCNAEGIALKAQGRLDEAAAAYRRSLELVPGDAGAWCNLGNVLHAQRHYADADSCFQAALARNPDLAEAHNSLGVNCQAQGDPDRAAACFRRALELRPDYAEAEFNLASALKALGQIEPCIAAYRRALALRPQVAEGFNNLGNALKAAGRLDESIDGYRQALAVRPDYVEARYNLANALKARGDLREAAAAYRQVLELRPDFAEALNNLGTILRSQGNLSEAAALFGQALALRPDSAAAQSNRAVMLHAQGRLGEAAEQLRRIPETGPYAEAMNNLGNVLKAQGKVDEAIACLARSLELNPRHVDAHSHLLLAMQSRARIAPGELAEAHAEFDRRHAAPLRAAWRSHPNAPDPQRRLRLGFVSPDLARHPVGYFLIPVLEALDRGAAELVCYSDGLRRDDLTERFQAAADRWHETSGVGDEALERQIRADQIDILFDLAGHTTGNRLLVFARRPAPVQITWIGYPGTTGLEAMDYILADRHEIPPGAERFYRERVLRMPDDYVCYEPPPWAPAVEPLPAAATGQVTLASFNNPAKIGADAVAIWARVLRALPGARLMLKYFGLDDPSTGDRYRAMFAEHGIGADCLELAGGSTPDQVMACYNRVDLALDTWPYSGGLTTCEALWMGVPVVTCPGDTFAGRHSLSHLSSVGLTETVARDFDDYVRIAASLAGDLPRLTELRAALRARMAQSPLCDGRRFAAAFLDVLRGVWRDWCASR